MGGVAARQRVARLHLAQRGRHRGQLFAHFVKVGAAQRTEGQLVRLHERFLRRPASQHKGLGNTRGRPHHIGRRHRPGSPAPCVAPHFAGTDTCLLGRACGRRSAAQPRAPPQRCRSGAALALQLSKHRASNKHLRAVNQSKQSGVIYRRGRAPGRKAASPGSGLGRGRTPGRSASGAGPLQGSRGPGRKAGGALGTASG